MTKVSLCDSPYCGEALWVNASCHHTLLDSRILAGVLIKRPRKRVTYSHMVAIVLLRLLRVFIDAISTCTLFKIYKKLNSVEPVCVVLGKRCKSVPMKQSLDFARLAHSYAKVISKFRALSQHRFEVSEVHHVVLHALTFVQYLACVRLREC